MSILPGRNCAYIQNTFLQHTLKTRNVKINGEDHALKILGIQLQIQMSLLENRVLATLGWACP